MRWSYSAPEQKLFIFDGRTSWLYVPEDHQATVHTITDAERRDLPFLVLTDAAALERLFVVRESRVGSEIISQLAPRSGRGVVRSLSITTSAADGRIHRLEYTDADGNHTVIEFSRFQPDRPAADAFTFTAPKGVEVIRN
jgi:outer membrane lipoprotein carrier protein